MLTSPFEAEDQAIRCSAFRASRIYTSIEQDLDARMVLGVICDGPVALKALCGLLPHLPETTLFLTLQRLEENGVIQGVAMGFNPTRKAYLLTDSAEAYRPVLRAIALSSPAPSWTSPGRSQRKST